MKVFTAEKLEDQIKDPSKYKHMKKIFLEEYKKQEY
jgi:hypothetical protein